MPNIAQPPAVAPKKYAQAPASPQELARAKNAESHPMPAIMQRHGYVVLDESPNMAAARKATQGRPIPDDFGMPSGTPIANKDTILPDLWKSFGRKEPACVYLFPKGQTNWAHAAVLYRHNGELICMNPVGRPKQPIANFMEASEYLFGVRELDHHDEKYNLTPRPAAEGGLWGNPEGGAYHRNFDMIVIWEWPQAKIDAMHAHFEGINCSQAAKKTRFRVMASKFVDFMDRIRGRDSRESVNCAISVSSGLEIAGLTKATRYPKKIAVQLLREIGRQDPDNLDIVSIGWVRHARRAHLSGSSSIAIPGVKQELGYYEHNSLIWTSPIPNLDTRMWNLGSRAAAYVHVEGEVARIVKGSRSLSRL